MAGGELGVPRGTSGIWGHQERDNYHPQLSLLARVDTQGSCHPLRLGAWLGRIMAPTEPSGRSLESLLGGRRVGSTKKREEKLKSRFISINRACFGRPGLTAEGGTGSLLAPRHRAWPGTWVLCPDPTCYCSFPLHQLYSRGTRRYFLGGQSEPKTVAVSPGSPAVSPRPLTAFHSEMKTEREESVPFPILKLKQRRET